MPSFPACRRGMLGFDAETFDLVSIASIMRREVQEGGGGYAAPRISWGLCEGSAQKICSTFS
jgi:hypothetical protein